MKRHSLGLCARFIAAMAVMVLLSGAMPPQAWAGDTAYTATVKGGPLRLREKPSDTGRVLNRYSSGTVVQVLADGEGYCRVLAPDGLEGYMMKEYLAFLNGLPPADAQASAAESEPYDWAGAARESALARGIDPSKPMLAITFDDGPSPATEAILDQLKAYGAKATFFVLGRNIAGNEAILKRAADEGHQLASHSWSHPNLDDLSSSAVRSQMTRTMNKIEEITGRKVSMMRPPYGASNRLTRRVMTELGLPVILWGVDSLDWKTRSASKISRA
ncbi:MAG: polysaccharide deacetylase family protein, partial [Eubacteriales bacterium]|nr:polysaccharide deacetylase family protein [Eubacteriales bacterium]